MWRWGGLGRPPFRGCIHGCGISTGGADDGVVIHECSTKGKGVAVVKIFKVPVGNILRCHRGHALVELSAGGRVVGWENLPWFNRSHVMISGSGRCPPTHRSRSAGEGWCRSSNLDDLWWWWQQRQEVLTDGISDFLALPAEEFASTIILNTFQSNLVGSENILVNLLDKFFVHLLDGTILLGPVPSVSDLVDHVDIFVIINQALDGFLG
ncbi:hypothetical protein AA313_de0209685 [Arthrobotrys entomopaga]|nr:hypothetical protein AA313_de0209685 [Arthrobotrys entomopaga]